jgi:hypothetical protein
VGVVFPFIETNGKTASSVLSPRSAVSPKMVGQMMHPSSPDKHGITVYSWEYLVKFTAFWDIALCRLVEIDRYFIAVRTLNHTLLNMKY